MAEDPEGVEGVITLQAVADRVAQGAALDEREVSFLFGSHDLIAIGMMADEVRRTLHGAETTFLRVFEMHVEAVPTAAPQGLSAGELRIVSRPASIDVACEAVKQARRLAAGVPLAGFSLADLVALGSSSSGVFDRLRDVGLDAVAETPVDAVSSDAVEAAREAGLVVQRLTVNAPARDPIALIDSARRLQTATGGFRAFAPLPRTLSIASPTTGYDDVKVVALARLWIRDIPSIQVDWPLYGPKLAQVALTIGADDVDGIAAVDAGTLGTRRSAIEEIRGNIRAAGLQAVERDGRFEIRGTAGGGAGDLPTR